MIHRIACILILVVLVGCKAGDSTGTDQPPGGVPSEATGPAPAAAPSPAEGTTLTPAERAAILRGLSEPVPVLPMQIEEMQVTGETKAYTLEPSYFPLALPDHTEVRVPVVLERIPYHLKASVQSSGATQEWTGDAWCFDLHSTAPAHPFTHTFWANTHKEPPPPATSELLTPQLQFFAQPNGEKYLVTLTTNHNSPRFIDMSQPASAEETLRAYISRKIQVKRPDMFDASSIAIHGGILYVGSAPVRYIPWSHLFRGDAFSTSWGDQFHLEVKDVRKDDQGSIVASLVGRDPNKVLRAVFDGKEWRAAEDETPTPP